MALIRFCGGLMVVDVLTIVAVGEVVDILPLALILKLKLLLGVIVVSDMINYDNAIDG